MTVKKGEKEWKNAEIYGGKTCVTGKKGKKVVKERHGKVNVERLNWE